MDKYHLPFRLGSRNCIVRNIAFLEVPSIVPQ